MVLFVISLLLVGAVVLGKYLIVCEIRRLEDVVRGRQQRLLEASGKVKVAHQKLAIAQKAEGLAAHKAATLKYRLAGLEDRILDVELQEMKVDLEKQRAVASVLDKVVRKALSQAGIEDEAHVRKVLEAVSSLIDLEKQGGSDDLIAAIREKLMHLKEESRTASQKETSPPLDASPPSDGASPQASVAQETAPVVLA